VTADFDGDNILKIFISSIVFIVVVILTIGIVSFDQSNKIREEEEILKHINRALVQCYALEGSYPSEITYLSKYGISFDKEKYEYFYEPFGNRVPTVQLILKNGGTGRLGGSYE